MSARTWTAEQKQAIEARGGAVLVSAAAGSGKTAVLVERVIRMVCDKENPVSLGRLLVVTFTKAAAAEMRERIGAALGNRLAEDPENAYLLRQQMLLPSAQICTIFTNWILRPISVLQTTANAEHWKKRCCPPAWKTFIYSAEKLFPVFPICLCSVRPTVR